MAGLTPGTAPIKAECVHLTDPNLLSCSNFKSLDICFQHNLEPSQTMTLPREAPAMLVKLETVSGMIAQAVPNEGNSRRRNERAELVQTKGEGSKRYAMKSSSAGR